MTNEERFMAGCQAVGEADVRQKLNAGRYSAVKSTWASSWLEQVDGAKSDAAKSEENNSPLANVRPNARFAIAMSAVIVAAVLASIYLFIRLN